MKKSKLKHQQKQIKKSSKNLLQGMTGLFANALDQCEANMLLMTNGLEELMNTGLSKEEAMIIIKESEEWTKLNNPYEPWLCSVKSSHLNIKRAWRAMQP